MYAWAVCTQRKAPLQSQRPLFPLEQSCSAGNRSRAECARLAVRVIEASGLTRRGTHTAGGGAGMSSEPSGAIGDAGLDPFANVSCEKACHTTKAVQKVRAAILLSRHGR